MSYPKYTLLEFGWAADPQHSPWQPQPGQKGLYAERGTWDVSPVGTPAAGEQEIKANDEGFGLSFFLHRLTDEALMEGFSDYSDLIAWGKHFLLIPCLSSLASRALPSHCRQRGHGLAQGMVPHGTALRFCQDLRTSPDKRPVPMAVPLPGACLGEPLGGPVHSPTLPLAPQHV